MIHIPRKLKKSLKIAIIDNMTRPIKKIGARLFYWRMWKGNEIRILGTKKEGFNRIPSHSMTSLGRPRKPRGTRFTKQY